MQLTFQRNEPAQFLAFKQINKNITHKHTMPTITEFFIKFNFQFKLIFKCMQLFKINNFLNGTPLQYSCLENPMDGGA